MDLQRNGRDNRFVNCRAHRMVNRVVGQQLVRVLVVDDAPDRLALLVVGTIVDDELEGPVTLVSADKTTPPSSVSPSASSSLR